MDVLGALQYGISGLSAILFIVTIGILRSEQQRETIRPEILKTLRNVILFAIFMTLVPAGVEIFKQKSKTDDEVFKAAVVNQVHYLAKIEDMKEAEVLGREIPDGDGKEHLAQLVSTICDATVELQRTVGEAVQSDACVRVTSYVKKHQNP
jgi:hypothetical protein